MWNSAMARAERPLSPHLQIYRWYFTMALSIAPSDHGRRAGSRAGAVHLVAARARQRPRGVRHRARRHALLVRRAWSCSSTRFTLFYHMANGIRHLAWDFGYGFDPTDRARLGRSGAGVRRRDDRADLAGRWRSPGRSGHDVRAHPSRQGAWPRRRARRSRPLEGAAPDRARQSAAGAVVRVQRRGARRRRLRRGARLAGLAARGDADDPVDHLGVLPCAGSVFR